MPTIYDTLESRWTAAHTANNRLGPARKHFNNVLAALKSIDAKKAELGKNALLSDAGRADELKKFLTSEVVPTIARASRTLAANERHLDARRRALLPSVREPNNVAAAILRAQIRDWLRDGNNNRVLFEKDCDARLLEAAIEAVPAMVGISDDQFKAVMKVYVEREHGASARQIEDESEALNILRVTAKIAVAELEKSVDLKGAKHEDGRPLRFAEWFDATAKAAGADAPDPDVAKMSVEATKADASKLSLGERTRLVDDLIKQNSAELTGVAS